MKAVIRSDRYLGCGNASTVLAVLSGSQLAVRKTLYNNVMADFSLHYTVVLSSLAVIYSSCNVSSLLNIVRLIDGILL